MTTGPIQQRTVRYRDRDGINWRVLTCHRDLLVGSLQQAISVASVIKKSPARTVLDISLQNREYILKVFHAPLLGDKIRAIIYPRATREWNNLCRLAQMNLPAPTPVALGFQGLEAYLLIEKISGTQTLKEVCFQPLLFERRRRITCNLATLVANLHNHGLLHRDLHFGNILLDKQDNLYVVDLHKIEQRRWLTQRACTINLALLGGSFASCASYLDHLRFLHHYHRHCRVFIASDFYRYAGKADACLLQQRRSYWLEKAQRCRRNNKYFKKVTVGTASGFAVHNDTRIDRLLCPVDRLIAGSEILKDSRSGLVVRTDHAIVKRYRRKKLRNWFIDCWRPSKAQKSWIAGHQCLVRGIATAFPLLFCERRYGIFLLDSWLVTEDISPSQTVYQYLYALSVDSHQGDRSKKTELLWRLGRFIRALHDRGLTHRDLKLNNLLIDESDRLYLIDLDGLRGRSKVSSYRQRKDLQRLIRSLQKIAGVTVEDIYRLLDGYRPFAPLPQKQQILHF